MLSGMRKNFFAEIDFASDYNNQCSTTHNYKILSNLAKIKYCNNTAKVLRYVNGFCNLSHLLKPFYHFDSSCFDPKSTQSFKHSF